MNKKISFGFSIPEQTFLYKENKHPYLMNKLRFFNGGKSLLIKTEIGMRTRKQASVFQWRQKLAHKNRNWNANKKTSFGFSMAAKACS